MSPMSHDACSVVSSRVNSSARAAVALPCHCSFAERVGIDMVVLRGKRSAIGRFRCPADHPSFRDSGPISECTVVFPRTSVRIRHDGSNPFLADPNVVTIYNRAQRYERFRISAEGDRCDWFSVDDDLAREIASAFDVDAGNAARPFRFEWTTSSAALYLRQRVLFRRAATGRADALETAEGVIGIVAEVLALAYRRRPQPLARRTSVIRRRHDLAEAARAELVRTARVNRSVHDLANDLATSPFHLCRVFRECTGQSMHEYRTELRLRLALELLEGTKPSVASLSAIAHEVGFASHSHFVHATRQRLGTTPSAVRQALSS